MRKFKSRKIFADELGMSPKTLLRKLKILNYCLPPGLISPEHQAQVWALLDKKQEEYIEKEEEHSVKAA